MRGAKLDIKEKFESAKDLLDIEKASAISAENFEKDSRGKKSYDSSAAYGDRRNEDFDRRRYGNFDRGGSSDRGRRQNDRDGNSRRNSCEFCKDGSYCRPEWDGFGCIELYRLNKKEFI